MRFEQTRTMPVELKRGWDYICDFRNWPDFYSGVHQIIEPESCAWHRPGDTVRFRYRLLGRSVEGRATLDVYEEGALVKLTARVTGLPDVVQEWHYTDLDDHFIVRVVMETEQANSFMGRLIEGTLLPRSLEKDLNRAMDGLVDIFEMGIPA